MPDLSMLTRALCMQVQSTMGTVHMDNVAKAGRDAPLLMFQLYVIKERDYTQKLIEGSSLYMRYTP